AKTTLLRVTMKLLKPTSGRVIYRQGGHSAASLKIGYLPQKNLIDARFPITVREVIASGLLADKSLSAEQRHERVDEVLDLVELQSHAGNAIGAISGGQLQRALLGRAIISQPPVLVLDEPLSYVDKHFEHRIYEIMTELASHTTILLVSHEMSTIAG
ncbi:MAG: ATP-binding cassette domain-containing protein, partial [Muribaculaceae bacterium]|nr:ATP-binding cassette domain-containing protein [Muribaculaceae bacterium]